MSVAKDARIYKVSEISRNMVIEGKPVILFAQVKEKIVKYKKGDPNDKYLDVNVIDGTGVINVKIWNYDEATDKRVCFNSIVKLCAYVKEHGNKVYLEVINDNARNMIRPAKYGEYNLSDLAETMPGVDPDSLKKSYMERITNLKMKHLQKLLLSIFNNVEISRDFFIYYAGKSHHHTYIGGLAKHSEEVAEISLLNAKMNRMDERQQDLVQTIAWLHDIGKLKEYTAPPFQEITVDGRLYGHAYMGARMVEQFIDSITNFPDEDRHVIVHGILSHHKHLEDGAVIVPAIPEAIIVSEADSMSSQVEGAIDFINKDRSEGGVTDYCTLKKQFFVKDMSFGKESQNQKTA